MITGGGFWNRCRSITPPVDEHAELMLTRAFEAMSRHLQGEGGTSRSVRATSRIWCAPRGYSGVRSRNCASSAFTGRLPEIASSYHTVLVSGIPQLHAKDRADVVRRLTWMIDVFTTSASVHFAPQRRSRSGWWWMNKAPAVGCCGNKKEGSATLSSPPNSAAPRRLARNAVEGVFFEKARVRHGSAHVGAKGLVNRKSIAALSATLAIATPVGATNYQDLVEPERIRLGIQIVQQADTLFLTWFIYNASGQPTWVVSDGVTRIATSPNVVYRGPVVAATGTFFGAPAWAAITPRVVGADDAHLHRCAQRYHQQVIDGTTVTKSITRQTLVPINIAFKHLSRRHFPDPVPGCSNTNNNGTSSWRPHDFSVAHTVGTDALVINELGGTLCRFSGTLTQFGSSYEATGSYTCQGGPVPDGPGR